jgi:hypothetical protein
MTVQAWALFAMTKEERLLLWVGVLAGVLIVGGVIIGRIDRWRKRQMQEEDDAPRQVGSFRSMYENGELSREEYDRVMRRMAERVGAKPKPATVIPPAVETVEPRETQEPPETPPA